ncbi:MAG: multidrug effflux MFS transporter [Pseudomonadota bacterium]
MSRDSRPFPSLREFIGIVALIMALISLSIDNLLPAFGPIQRALGVTNANDMQLIVTVYMLGSGAMQIFYGPLSDVIGRRPSLMIGLAVYAVGALLGLFAQSYEMLLVGRLIQGMGAAAAQVLSVALVRDRYEGSDMARVLSLVFMVFIMVPVIAPGIGQLLIALSGWRAVFASMLAMALLVGVWFGLRMPETLRPEHRMPHSFRRVGQGIALTFRARSSMGYGVAIALMMGCLMTYVSTSQQIFETEVYGLGPKFPFAFGSIAAVMGVAFFANSHLVRSFGMRKLSHICLIAFLGMTLLSFLAAVFYDGKPPLLLFCALLSAMQFLMCLIFPNFNAMAMEPLGAVAGTASAVLGVFTTVGGTIIGMIVGRTFDGTVLPLGLTYFVCAVLALLVVLWAEKGRLVAAPVRIRPTPTRKAT